MANVNLVKFLTYNKSNIGCMLKWCFENWTVDNVNKFLTIDGGIDLKKLSDEHAFVSGVVVDSLDTDEEDVVLRVTLKGHAGYPGGETAVNLGSGRVIIHPAALSMLYAEYLYAQQS